MFDSNTFLLPRINATWIMIDCPLSVGLASTQYSSSAECCAVTVGNIQCIYPLQIAAQAFVFLLAGYDTTANALSFVTYLLAINPEKEEAMVAEIDAFGAGLTPTYDDLQKVLLRSTPSIFGFDVSSTHFCTIAAIPLSHISN